MAAKMAKIGGRKVRSPRVPHSFWRDQCKNIIFALGGMHNPCRTSAWAKELPRKCGARGKSCLTTTERQRFRLAFGLAVRFAAVPFVLGLPLGAGGGVERVAETGGVGAVFS